MTEREEQSSSPGFIAGSARSAGCQPPRHPAERVRRSERAGGIEQHVSILQDRSRSVSAAVLLVLPAVSALVAQLYETTVNELPLGVTLTMATCSAPDGR